jgi:hypothetical protein
MFTLPWSPQGWHFRRSLFGGYPSSFRCILFLALFLFPYPFWKKVGKHSDHENAGSISRSKRPTYSGPLTTCPPPKICHDPPVLGHIPEIGTSGRRNPFGARGGWTLNWPISQNLVYFSHMSSSNFPPLRGACDLWKSCSKCEAKSIKHRIKTCFPVISTEIMSYHILQGWDLILFVRNLFFYKHKSCSAR